MEYSLSDLIDVKKCEELCNSFYANLKLNIAIIDSAGRILLTSGAGTTTHTQNIPEDTESRTCKECSTIFESHFNFNDTIISRCKNNIHTLDLPIICNNEIFGELIAGPFIFRTASRKYNNLNDNHSGKEVPVFSKKEAQEKFLLIKGFLNLLEDNISTKIDRRKAEQSLALEQDFMRTLMTNIPDAIYFKDQQSRFLKVSNAKALKHGFANPDEIIGKTDFDVFSKEHAQQAFETEQEILQTGNSRINIEEMEVWKDRKPSWVSSTKMALRDKDGYTIGTFGISRDITAGKEAELEINRVNKELKELNATKDKFFSIIAHDLKSPFSALLGISEMLTDPDNNTTGAENKEMLQHLRELIKKEYELLQNLLDWACMQLGRMEYLPTGINLYRIAANVLSLLSPNAVGKNISLLNLIDDTVFISADVNMVKSIIQNFVSNSIKFTNTGGTVSIFSRVDGEFATVIIQDNGIGINKDDIVKLFHLDTNFTTPGTHGEKGTGLGTLLCKEMVEKHGGKVSIYSSPDSGTTVEFTIPLLK